MIKTVGRPKIEDYMKKKPIHVKLSPWLVKYIQNMNINKSVLVENALIKELSISDNDVLQLNEQYLNTHK